MNSNYYETVLIDIEKAISQDDKERARRLIENELSMPYIPSEYEDRLLKLKKQCKEIKPSLEVDDEMLAYYLASADKMKELIAVNKLDNLNLRQYHELISDYLLNAVNDNARSLLISALIEQGVKEEYKVIKNGVEYDFIPLYCESIDMSDGYKSAQEFIESSIACENASLAQMAHKLIVKVCFDALPLSIDAEEGIIYAKSIIMYLYDLLGDDAAMADFAQRYIKESDKLIEKEALEQIFDV